MNTALSRSIAVVALVSATPVLAQEAGDESVAANQMTASGDAAIGEVSPVQLVSWDGDFELLKTSRRLRIWRSHLAYTMTVDPQGQITGCTIADAFRRKYINDTLCDVLIEHHTFAPAKNEAGRPVQGDYAAKISYLELRNRQ